MSPLSHGLRAAVHCAASELRRTVRDPHVIGYLLLPVVVYPLLMWGTAQLALYEEGRLERQDLRVEVTGPSELVEHFDTEPFVAGSGGTEALRSGELDAVVEGSADGERWSVTVHHDSTRARSRRGLDEVEDRLGDVRRARIDALGAGEVGWKLSSTQVNGLSETLAAAGVVTVAFIAALAMMLSGVYPAVDMITAEREKGTLESLLLVGIPRWSPLLGKLFATTLLMLLSAAANLTALAITVAHAATLAEFDIAWTPDPLGSLLVLPPLLATAFMLAALLMLVVTPARTFKEAELLGTSAIMLACAPAIVGVIALVTGDPSGLALVPVANLLLAAHDGTQGELGALVSLGITAMNAALGCGLLAAMVALARREDFLIGGRLPRWLAWLHRSEARP